MRTHAQVISILEAAHINPTSFEAELGLLCHKWIMLKGLDDVLDGLDHEVQALEGRRDLELAATSRKPSRT